MKISSHDWQKLSLPLLGLGFVLVLMAFVVGYTQQKSLAAKESLTKQEGLLNQARQRYQTSGQEKEIIIRYLPVYQRLIQEGWVGEERRIDWVDNLRSIHQQQKLFGINYSIGAQERYTPLFAVNMGSFILHRSVMKLELSMLHEGDLLTLLAALDAAQTAPFIVRECEVSRQTDKPATKLVPNFLANCELDWLTIHEPQAVRANQ